MEIIEECNFDTERDAQQKESLYESCKNKDSPELAEERKVDGKDRSETTPTLPTVSSSGPDSTTNDKTDPILKQILIMPPKGKLTTVILNQPNIMDTT